MKDTALKGTGNSRLIKTTSDFLKKYPTYEDFAAALIQGEVPIDLSNLQDAGVVQKGTGLNKANLLSDATETDIFGDAANRTVNQALDQLATLVKTAQGTADDAQVGLQSRVKLYYSSYTGTGANREAIEVNLGFMPVFMYIVRNTNSAGYGEFAAGVRPGWLWGLRGASDPVAANVTWGADSISFTPRYAMELNTSGSTYRYVIFGI